MTKADLIAHVAQRKGLQHKKAEMIVNLIFEEMSEALKSNDRIEIRGFGSFVNREYGSYEGRNPKTGESVYVPPKRVPFFKVGKELAQVVNSGGKAQKEGSRSSEDST